MYALVTAKSTKWKKRRVQWIHQRFDFRSMPLVALELINQIQINSTHDLAISWNLVTKRESTAAVSKHLHWTQWFYLSMLAIQLHSKVRLKARWPVKGLISQATTILCISTSIWPLQFRTSMSLSSATLLPSLNLTRYIWPDDFFIFSQHLKKLR